ncbi:MAG: ammonium transporter [Acidimicrobiia bacterium]|nr:ammonium transporter [Acidimicrobiia bacterium]
MRRKLVFGGCIAALALLVLAGPATAQEVSDQYDRTVSSGAEAMNMVVLDNIFIFLAGVLVFLMQPGFALVEAGLTRAKNAANIMMKNLMDMCIGVLAFAAIGWGIAYPGDFNGWVSSAGLGIAGFFDGALVDISPEALASDDFYPLAVPVDFFFQAAFAATAATIVSGAVAGRTKFVGYLCYSALVTAFIYPIVVSWKWGAGWLDELGFIDFAGSGLVHMTGGFAALAGAMVLGPRIGKYGDDGKPRALPGHSIPLAMAGVLLLFIGWFGFNPGSQLQADMAVPVIAVLTAFAAASGGGAAMLTSWLTMSKPDVSMAGNGILAGLVAICSGIAEMSWLGTMITGGVAGVIVVLSVLGIERAGIDDPVGAFSVHGVCGFWGLLATGLFATTSPINGAEESAGLLYGGGAGLLADQVVGGVVIAVFVFAAAGAMFMILKAAGLLRVDPADEVAGLDISEHGSPGYGPDILAATATV